MKMLCSFFMQLFDGYTNLAGGSCSKGFAGVSSSLLQQLNVSVVSSNKEKCLISLVLKIILI